MDGHLGERSEGQPGAPRVHEQLSRGVAGGVIITCEKRPATPSWYCRLSTPTVDTLAPTVVFGALTPVHGGMMTSSSPSRFFSKGRTVRLKLSECCATTATVECAASMGTSKKST